MSITQDIKEWSESVLEVPNPYLGGLPACPYAKAAWYNNRVKIVETKNIFREALKQCGDFDNNKHDLVICASFGVPIFEHFNDWVELKNNLLAKDDLHIMGFHPEYGAEDAELDFLYDHEWESSVQDEYCMMFIQSLSQVDDASQKLEQLDYYKIYPEPEYQELVIKRRAKRYGDETKSNEKENPDAGRRNGSIEKDANAGRRDGKEDANARRRSRKKEKVITDGAHQP
jgi:hypothetical protein